MLNIARREQGISVAITDRMAAWRRERRVLISEIQPRKRRHELLHNQRGLLLAAALRSRTDVVVATLPYRLHD